MVDNHRDVWVDNVKVIACFLVVLGHLLQSMVKSGIFQETALYKWFDATIYLFHVPLFFICSGFLYQKYADVYSFKAWGISVCKKLVVLGVPYFVFTIVTWIMKGFFSSYVNDQRVGLIDTLIKQPTSQLWYLYVLFVFFVVTINTKNKKQQIILLILSGILKLINCFGIYFGVVILDNTLPNWFWFVLGMSLTYDIVRIGNAARGAVVFGLFLVSTVVMQMKSIGGGIMDFILGFLACYGVISIMYSCFRHRVQNRLFQYCSVYTMPVFLMHTIFAAGFRSVLFKVGVSNPIIHLIVGLITTFYGPIIAMIIMEKMKPLDFIVYPTRYVKIGKR